MKHRFINKKTGVEARVIAMYLDSDGVMQVDGYDAVEDLMDDYAAYEKYEPPKEPLIKDEKTRKFISDYFEIWGWKTDKGTKFKIEHFDYRTRIYCDTFEIVLPKIDELDICRSYTIEELCGEDEE